VTNIQSGNTNTAINIGTVQTGNITMGASTTNTFVDGSLNVMQIQGGTTGEKTIKIGVVNTGDITIGKSGKNVFVDGTLKTSSIQSTGNFSLGTNGYASSISIVNSTGAMSIGTATKDVTISGNLISSSVKSTGDFKLGTTTYDSSISIDNDTGNMTIGNSNKTITVNGTLSGYATSSSIPSIASDSNVLTLTTAGGTKFYIERGVTERQYFGSNNPHEAFYINFTAAFTGRPTVTASLARDEYTNIDNSGSFLYRRASITINFISKDTVQFACTNQSGNDEFDGRVSYIAMGT
jgi:hypothetical protein